MTVEVMLGHFLKFWLYLDRELLVKAIKHPIRTIRGIRFLSGESNYLKFVSEVTDSPIALSQSFVPSKGSEKLLLLAFKKSISPISGHPPCSPDIAMSLYLVTRILKPMHVVETGVSAGRSSSYILCALKDNEQGELFSIDPDPEAGYAIPHELKERWHFINDISKNTLPNLLEQLDRVDIFFHDSLHTYENMTFEFDATWPRLSNGGLLMADNVNLHSALNDFSRRIKRTPMYLNERFAGIRKL